MVLRVFGFIWGTIILTMALFALLVSAFDLGPPEGAQREMAQRIVAGDLALIEARDGIAAAEAHWARIAAAHPDLEVTHRADCEPGACLEVRERAVATTLWDGFKPFVVPLLTGGAISALAAIVLSHWLTRPLRTVSRALTRLAEGEFDTRIGDDLKGSTGEVARLARDFDHAAERLQDLSEQRKRLFHDVSHEIRSPLARMRAAIGLLRLRPDRQDELRMQMETDVARMDYLMDSILTLVRLDSDLMGREAEGVDLLDVLEPILADANFEGEARGITVRYTGPEQLVLTGDAELLHRALENVIRNALSYSPDGGEVVVTGATQDGRISIEVTDSGPGVDAADLPRLFRPFHRGANAHPARGSGLGLAIAGRAVALHDGGIEAVPGAAGGLTIRLWLAGGAA